MATLGKILKFNLIPRIKILGFFLEMRNLILLLLTIIPITLVSCSKPNDEKFDIDISNFKSIKTNNTTNENESKKFIVDQENKSLIKNLVTPKTKDQILSNTKFGKKDPFSKDDVQINQLNADLKLTGFINTENNKYAIVKYLNNEGKLTEESVGGLNTNLLPNGAKVKIIDPKNNKLIISLNKENFIFEF